MIFTWNVGNAMPIESELATWLPLGGGDYDVVVVGTQENAFKEHKQQSHASPNSNVSSAEVTLDLDDDDEKVEIPLPDAAGNKKSGKPMLLSLSRCERVISQVDPLIRVSKLRVYLSRTSFLMGLIRYPKLQH